MTLDHLRVFAAVARHKNVTRASKELHISQPAVTKHLRILEESYSAKLYTRGGTGIELTNAGRMFLRYVKSALKHDERIKHKLSQANSRMKTESLTVGGSYSPSASLLPSLMASFKRRHPNVEVSLQTGTKTAIERMVVNSEIDIAVITNAPSNRLLTIEPFRREPLLAFVSKMHPLSTKRHLKFRDIGRVPLVIRKPAAKTGTAEQFLQRAKQEGVKLNIAMRCESPEAVKAFVRTKMGIGLLFQETVEPELKSGEFKALKLLEQNLEGQSFIVYRSNRPLSPAAQDFLSLIREEQRQLEK
jgi:DNA-binding transcriptional LysR family regulator